jgi:DNA-binding FadR family transcriptional regulator
MRESHPTCFQLLIHHAVGHLNVAFDAAVLVAMLRTLMEELTPYLLEMDWSPKRHEETDTSHARLYSALVDGDVQVARNEVRTHLQVSYDTLLDEIRQPPEMPGRNGA